MLQYDLCMYMYLHFQNSTILNKEKGDYSRKKKLKEPEKGTIALPPISEKMDPRTIFFGLYFSMLTGSNWFCKCLLYYVREVDTHLAYPKLTL